MTPATWQTGLLIWLKFAVAAAAIAYAGYRLSACGDIIAEKKGWGRVWLGTALMAAVTSLPELVSTVSAVAVTQAPDIAMGEVLGSCAFNLLLISLLDLLYLKTSRATVFDFTSRGHVISGGFGVFMLGLIPLSMGLRPQWGVPALGRVSLAALLLALFYLLAVRSVFQYETSAADERSYTQLYGEMSLRAAVRGFILNALVVAVAGSYLPVVGVEIAAFHGWGASLVGTLLMALATSLPEIVVTVGAVWLGAIDLAVGNIFGSNLFNLFVLFCGDLAYAQGPLLARVAPVHLVTATIAMMMTGLALVGMILRPRRLALPLLSWVTLCIVLLFLLNAVVLIGMEAF